MDDSYQSHPGASCSNANTLNVRTLEMSDDAVNCRWASVIDPGTIFDRSNFRTMAWFVAPEVPPQIASSDKAPPLPPLVAAPGPPPFSVMYASAPCRKPLVTVI